MKASLEKIKSKAVPVLKEAGVARSSIFGSYVRGEEKADSDIDILVEPPKGMSLFGFIGLQNKLEMVLDKKVDLGEYSTLKPRIKDSVLKEAIPIL